MAPMIRRVSLPVLTVAFGVLLLGGCAKHGADQPTPPPAVSSTPGPGGYGGSPSTLSIAGQFMLGADHEAIQGYLRTVREVKPNKFEVKWNADTVAVSREEAMRALRSIDAHGEEFTFSKDEPVVAKLVPGRILWIWDIALRRIDRVDDLGRTIAVHTKPIPLNEAMTDATIEFEAPTHFGDAYGTYRPRPPDPPPAVPHTASSRHMLPFMHVSLRKVLDSPDAQTTEGTGSGDATGAEKSSQSEDTVAGTMDGFSGEILGFEYAIGYKVEGEKLLLQLEGRKNEEGGGNAESTETTREHRREFFEAIHEQHEARHRKDEAKDKWEHLKKLHKEIDAELDTEYHDPANGSMAGKSAAAQEGVKALERLAIRQKGSVAQEGADALDRLGKAEEKRLRGEMEQLSHTYKEEFAKEHAAEVKAKRLAKAGALAKHVFDWVSENIDMRFRGRVQVDGAVVKAALQMASGRMEAAKVSFSHMSGRVGFEWIGRLGQPGSGIVNFPLPMHLPVGFNVPLPIGGIPFVVELGADFLLKVGLSGLHATQHLDGHYSFGGDAGMHSAAGGAGTDGGIAATDLAFNNEGISPGASAVVLAVQLPKMGLGLGMFGAGAMAFVDVVTVISNTNSAAVALGVPSCQRATLDIVPHVGVEIQLMPLPIPLLTEIGSMMLTQKVELKPTFHRERSTDKKMCKL